MRNVGRCRSANWLHSIDSWNRLVDVTRQRLWGFEVCKWGDAAGGTEYQGIFFGAGHRSRRVEMQYIVTIERSWLLSRY